MYAIRDILEICLENPGASNLTSNGPSISRHLLRDIVRRLTLNASYIERRTRAIKSCGVERNGFLYLIAVHLVREEELDRYSVVLSKTTI